MAEAATAAATLAAAVTDVAVAATLVAAAVDMPTAVAAVVLLVAVATSPAVVAVVTSPAAAADMLAVADTAAVVAVTARSGSADGGAHRSSAALRPVAQALRLISLGVTLRSICPLCLLSALTLSGCSSHIASTHQEHIQQRAEIETEREQLERIPPPAKSTFMSVHTFDSWQNPVLTVQPSMLELQVTLADANTTSIGVGGMFRPVGARRQELNISLDTLGDAISAVPASSWPYGRVVAIEEANKTPRSAEPAVRRNMEVTISRLNDLGIIVYDLSSGRVD